MLERRLFDELDRAVDPFLAKYTRPDGRLIWRETLPAPTRDGADDFYEAFYNWPLLYFLGGGDDLLPIAHRQWDAVTRQLTDLGRRDAQSRVRDEQSEQGDRGDRVEDAENHVGRVAHRAPSMSSHSEWD